MTLGQAGASNPFAGPDTEPASATQATVRIAARGAASREAPNTARSRMGAAPGLSPSSDHRDDSMLGLGMSQEELLGHIQHNLTLIQNSLQLSVGMIDMIGTENDSTALRKRVNDVLSAVASKINRTRSYIGDIASSEDRKKKRGSIPVVTVAVRKKLEKDLNKLKARLADTERQMKLKERQFGAFLRQMEAEAEARAQRSQMRNVSDSSVSSIGGSSYGGEGNPFADDFDVGNGRRSSDNSDDPNIGGVRGLVTSDGAYISRDQVQRRLQQQMLIEGEIEVNEAMINERNSAMRKINRDLRDVREIFSDLATMVEDQDEAIGESRGKLIQVCGRGKVVCLFFFVFLFSVGILPTNTFSLYLSSIFACVHTYNNPPETIADNVEKSAVAAEKGRKQLEKANELQRNRCMIC